MSGVYIGGMEMPTGCDTCPFEHFGDCYGGKAKRIMDIDEEIANGVRHKRCPLVPVPDHGDLIDRQALLQEFYKAQKSYDAHGRPFADAFMSGNEICAEWWTVECKVEDAPTVIPTDEEEQT